MYLLFDEAGKFLAGKVLSEADASFQVELGSGKRVKVKAANALLKFEKPEPEALVAKAHALAQSIELDMAWEFAPEGDFGFAELAAEYFASNGKPAALEQQAGMLFALFDAPHYFRRAGKGRFRKADAQTIQLALAAIEKKKYTAVQIAQWAKTLSEGKCPQPVQEQQCECPRSPGHCPSFERSERRQSRWWRNRRSKTPALWPMAGLV